jgi:2-oxoisovalerate dehydrogenase E2 component (dihydrolipoyl transacylase)
MLARLAGVKLTYMPFLVKAASIALKAHPRLNSHVSADCTEVTIKGAHHIGVAMDTPRGLLVPNIKHADQRSVFEIALELDRYAPAARRRRARLTPAPADSCSWARPAN